jgi:hypothetical protein
VHCLVVLVGVYSALLAARLVLLLVVLLRLLV